MANSVVVDGTPTNGAKPLIDSLVAGVKWVDDDGGRVTINYALKSGTNPFSVGPDTGDPWLPGDISALVRGMAAWEAVANIDFVETASGGADIWYWLTDNAGMVSAGKPATTLGFHEFPGAAEPRYGVFNTQASSWDHTADGGDGFHTILHELGHGLGLAHPHDGGGSVDPGATRFPGVTSSSDWGDFNLNQGIWTAMSYNVGWPEFFTPNIAYGMPVTPMALDIAAIQLLYGANMNHNADNQTYVLPTANAAGTGWSCIWDAGGDGDAISNEGSNSSAYIDLRPAPLVGEFAGGYVSAVLGVAGGFTIAANVLIEDAFGGGGNDTLVGNDGDNSLVGNGGNDLIYGSGGVNDVLDGGTGLDTASFAHMALAIIGTLVPGGGLNPFRVDGENSTFLKDIENVIGSTVGDRLTGSDEANRFDGEAGGDTLEGMGGKDFLFGGADNDTLDGGAGSDTAFYDDKTVSVVVTLNKDVAVSVVVGGVVEDSIRNVESLTGGSAADTFTGDSKVNRFTGKNGNDVLKGMAGDDILNGGAGADTLTGGADADTFKFDSIAHSGLNAPKQDTVTDFVHLTDDIDLRKIDASTILDGNDSFAFIGTSNFSATSAGQLRFQQVNNSGTANDYTMVYGDTDADTGAEFAIRLTGLINLTSDDFLL